MSLFQLPYFEAPLCGFLSIFPACGSKYFLNLLLDFFHQFWEILDISQLFEHCPLASSALRVTLMILMSDYFTVPCITYAFFGIFIVFFFPQCFVLVIFLQTFLPIY